MVRVSNVVKTYEMGKVKVNALRGANLHVKSGEFISIMGASGGGKSTMLHIMGGIDNCTSGSILIDGREISKMDDREITTFRRRNIGFVFQTFNLMPTLSVEENVRLPLQIAGIYDKSKDTKIGELLDFVGLFDRRDHRPSQLSGGEQQRVAIARALVIEPKIILLDEPTGSLDSKNGDKILELLRHTHEEYKSTIIMVTHSPFAAEYCEKTVFMKDGIVADFIDKKSSREYSSRAIYDIMARL